MKVIKHKFVIFIQYIIVLYIYKAEQWVGLTIPTRHKSHIWIELDKKISIQSLAVRIAG